MCIYCAGQAGPHVSFDGPPPPFSSLQLSQADYDAYLGSLKSRNSFSNPDLARADGPRIRVTSASPDVQEALKNVSESGEPAVETTYSIMESILWLMQRL
jgi:hypothetical protein